MNKHTEGDWWYERNWPDAKDPIDEWAVQCDNGCESEGGRGPKLIAEVYSEHDARLIAAAPEMFEALEQIEWVSDDTTGGYDCIFCHRDKKQGHAPNCRIASILAKVKGDE